ncbi:hypothetical protein [Paracidovorax valerianellae]|uniref:hypothetical protein n=1 Tax=Paracidovorax valerianellae TaxID=187868 RepID=UPI0023026381|nr:hypothetical protein [Paracidovorax valerianellae]MDA8446793.1 hypothetical protein [Paracidovorax valerianellae]
MPSSPIESFKQLKRYDDNRPGFKGEHWLVLGAGVALLLASRRSPSALTRTVGSAVGSAMLMRAASGRQGLARVLQYLPIGKRW